ncbi:MAG TPA: hypothetical protein VEG62_00135 [Acidimicrobiales bacterium]|nr:hypothetical protein [Acidimicrobiales bacterium]
MGRGSDTPRKQIVELLQGRPGWRLEPRTTPGASPLWCFVVDGEIQFSVTAEEDLIRLYVMATDEEVVLRGVDELTAWLQAHRADALQAAPPRQDRRSRFKSLFEWG